eukprot:CFRG0825T1
MSTSECNPSYASNREGTNINLSNVSIDRNACHHELKIRRNGDEQDQLFSQVGVGADASLSTSLFNLCNTILGGGLLTMPFVFKTCGVPLGIVIISGGALMSMTGLLLLIASTKQTSRSHNSSYAKLASNTYPSLTIVVDIAVVLKTTGVAVGYLIIIGDVLPETTARISGLELDNILARRETWITIAMICLIPLCYLRDLSSLKYNIFSVYKELVQPTDARMREVVVGSVGMSYLVYLATGICGYLSFGADTKVNILQNYSHDDFAANMARFGISFMALGSFPLQAHPLRNSLVNVLSRCDRQPAISESTVTEPSESTFNVCTAIVCTTTYLLALMVHDLGTVFRVVGANCSTSLCYVTPALFFLKLNQHHRMGRKVSKVLFAAGCLISVLANYTILQSVQNTH